MTTADLIIDAAPSSRFAKSVDDAELAMRIFTAVAGSAPTIGPPLPAPRPRWVVAGHQMTRWCAAKWLPLKITVARRMSEGITRMGRAGTNHSGINDSDTPRSRPPVH